MRLSGSRPQLYPSVTRIMRVDLCAVSQLLLFRTTKRDIPEDPLIKGPFRASRSGLSSPSGPPRPLLQKDPRRRRAFWIWIPVVRFLVVEFANKLESCDFFFFFFRKGRQTKLESKTENKNFAMTQI